MPGTHVSVPLTDFIFSLENSYELQPLCPAQGVPSACLYQALDPSPFGLEALVLPYPSHHDST